MVRTPDWKLVWVPGANTNGFRLYELPDEKEVVSERHPEIVAELRADPERILATEREPSDETPMMPEELKTLKCVCRGRSALLQTNHL